MGNFCNRFIYWYLYHLFFYKSNIRAGGFFTITATVNSKLVAIQTGNTLIPTVTGTPPDTALFRFVVPVVPTTSVDVTTATQVKHHLAGT